MKWMKDSELFSDIDAHGKLVSNEFTQSVVKGQAADSIRGKREIAYNMSGRISEHTDASYQWFSAIMSQIRKYVYTHDHIGKFPSEKQRVHIIRYKQQYHSSYTPGALDKASADVNKIVDERTAAVSEIHSEAYRLGVDVSAEANIAHEKLEKYRQQELSILQERAKEMDLPNDGRGTSSGGSSREILSEKYKDYNFFDMLDSWLPGMTQITAVEGHKANWKRAITAECMRIVLWGLLLGGTLLLANFLWGAETPFAPVFARLGFQSSLTILYILCSGLFIWLSWTSELDISIRQIPVPIPAFFFPFLFSSMAAASEAETNGGKEFLSEKWIENLGMISLWGTAILLLINLVLRSDFFTNIGASIVTLGLLFLGMGMSCALVYELVTESPAAFRITCGVLFAAVIVGVLINVRGLLRQGGQGAWNDKLLKNVSENALLEYKELRFLWLWVHNTAKTGRDSYLAAVERELTELKRKVAEAEAYAASKHKPFELKMPKMVSDD